MLTVLQQTIPGGAERTPASGPRPRGPLDLPGGTARGTGGEQRGAATWI